MSHFQKIYSHIGYSITVFFRPSAEDCKDQKLDLHLTTH